MCRTDELVHEGYESVNPDIRAQALACRAALDQLDAALDADARVALRDAEAAHAPSARRLACRPR